MDNPEKQHLVHKTQGEDKYNRKPKRWATAKCWNPYT